MIVGYAARVLGGGARGGARRASVKGHSSERYPKAESSARGRCSVVCERRAASGGSRGDSAERKGPSQSRAQVGRGLETGMEGGGKSASRVRPVRARARRGAAGRVALRYGDSDRRRSDRGAPAGVVGDSSW